MRNTQYPENWEKIKLGEVMTVIRGASPRPKGDPRYFGGSIPWVKISDITKVPGKYIYETKDHVTEAGAEKSRLLKKGSLILSNSGTVCVPKFLGVDGCIHDGFVSFPDIPEEIHKDFLLEYFNWIRPYVINENRQGITQVNLNTGIVRDFDLPIPPLPEQHRIVAAIENYFSRLDKAVEALERVKANLKRYRASVLKAAVEGRLVPTEAELARAEGRGYEPASVLLERILKERRKKWEEAGRKGKYKEPAAPDTDGLPKLPEGWCWATVEQLFWTVTDGDHQAPPKAEEGIPFLVIGNIKTGSLNFENSRHVKTSYFEKLDTQRKPEQGDILYSVTGSFGIPVFVDTEKPFCVQRHIGILKPTKITNALLYTRFLGSQFVFSQAAEVATGTAQMTVPLSGLRRIVVPLPPTAEQDRILVELDRQYSVIENTEFFICTNLQRTTRLRQSILKWAFEGKLADQDPNDEPASELLERILQEREAMKPKKKTRKPRRKKK